MGWCRPARLSASGGEITTRPVRTAAVASSRRHGSPPTIGAKAASPRYLQRRALPVITDTADGAGTGAQPLCPGDRKSDVEGKSVSVRVGLAGRGLIQNKNSQ